MQLMTAVFTYVHIYIHTYMTTRRPIWNRQDASLLTPTGAAVPWTCDLAQGVDRDACRIRTTWGDKVKLFQLFV